MSCGFALFVNAFCSEAVAICFKNVLYLQGKKFHGSLKVWKKRSLLIDFSKFSKIIRHYALTASAHNSGSPVYKTADLSGMTLFVFDNTCSYYFNWIEENKVKLILLTGPYVFILQSPRGEGPLLVYHSIQCIYILMWQSVVDLWAQGVGMLRNFDHECDIILSSIRGQAGKKLTSIIYLYFTVTNVK